MEHARRQESARQVLWRQTALFLLPLTALHLGFNFSLGDLFFFAVVGASLTAPRRYHQPAVWLALLTGVLLGASTAMLYLRGLAVGSLVDGMQAVVIFVFVIPLGWTVFEGMSLRQICRPLIAAALVNAVAVAVQLIAPTAFLPTQASYGMAEFGLRPLGLTGNPNGLGLLMTWAVPLGIYLGAEAETRRGAVGWAVVTVLVALAGMLSFSKAALVGIPLTLLVSQILLGRRHFVLATVLVVGLALLGWTLRSQLSWLADSLAYRLLSPDSLESRLTGVVVAWAHVPEWLWFGVGPGGDNIYGEGVAQIHNQLLGFLVQFGLLAAVAFWCLKVLLGVEALRLLLCPRWRVVALVFLVAEVAVTVHPVYWIRAHYLPWLLLLWALGAPTLSERTDPGSGVALT